MSTQSSSDKLDDRAFLLALLRSLRDEGFNIANIDNKLALIGPIDQALLKRCIRDVTNEAAVPPPAPMPVAQMQPIPAPTVRAPANDPMRSRIARFVR